MTLHDYVTALRKHWIVIVVLTILGGGAAYVYSQLLPEEYRSQAAVMVIPARGDNTSELVQGSNYVQGIVQTYTILATSPTVLDPVIDELDLDEQTNRLARRVDVNVPLNTTVIQIGVTDATPEGAQKTANAIARELAVAVGELSPVGADDQPAVRIETISPARLATVPIAPNTRLNVIIGAVLGLALGVVYAIFSRRFFSRVTSSEDIEDATDVPVLGEVVAAGDNAGLARTLRSNPDGRVAESLRQVAASLKFVEVDADRRVIMVTSGSSSEGKSSVSLGIAMTLAEIGHSVLYIEADLRRPSAARYTQLEGSVGLTTVLIGEVTLQKAVQPWGHPNLSVLTSGSLPPNPGQLLSSGQLQHVIDEARTHYEYVIVDTAPVLSVSDALWLSSMVDGTLFVVRANRTTSAEIKRSLAALESTRSPLLGVILNGAKGNTKSPYYTDEPRRTRTPLTRRLPRDAKKSVDA